MTVLYLLHVAGTFTAGDGVKGGTTGTAGIVVSFDAEAATIDVTIETPGPGFSGFILGEVLLGSSGAWGLIGPSPTPIPDTEEGTPSPSLTTSTSAVVDAATGDPAAIVAALFQAVADGGDVAAYTINGRTVQLRSLGEIIAAIKFFQAQVARRRGLRQTLARFTK